MSIVQHNARTNMVAATLFEEAQQEPAQMTANK